MAQYCHAWEYTVKPDALPKFEAAFGPDGDWAHLYRRDDAYVEIELLQDRQVPYRYVAIDRWTSYEAYAVFRERHRKDFEALERHCKEFTENDRRVGDFEVATPQ